MHVCITLRFAGTRYHGFQVQKNALSVCEVLQNALESLYGVRPPVKGCSRTDSGVHALGYCVSYTQPKPIPPRKLPLAVNRFLPDDVRVTEAHRVPEDFHARYSAKSKEYIYRIHNSAVADPFQNGLCWRFPGPLDAGRMERAAQYLVGKHDFVSFMSSGSDIADTVRTVYFAHVRREGDDITFHVCADGYLYNMVRIFVGTLVEAGAGRMPPERVRDILEEKKRSLAGYLRRRGFSFLQGELLRRSRQRTGRAGNNGETGITKRKREYTIYGTDATRTRRARTGEYNSAEARRPCAEWQCVPMRASRAPSKSRRPARARAASEQRGTY